MSILVDEDEPLVDVEDPPFEPRDVQVQNKDVELEFDIYDFLGRGKFGEVKRCVERTTGKEFAAKFINAPRPQDKKEVEQEVEIMKRLQHKRLLQLYDCFCSKTEMCLVLEIILGGELFDRVIDEDFILTERACVVFMRQICEGVQYMHGKNIIHLDMKPENILCLTRTGNRIKIIDFGLAREYNPKKDLRVLFGTPEFMAPEVVQYDPISFSTDMWSVGVICYVLLSGLSPFMGDNDGDTLVNVMKGEYDFNYAEFNDVSDNAKDLINKLLLMNKSKRLTATQCLEHPWLRREKPRTSSSNLDLSKKRLKRFVYRRKWQKIVNAIIALKRMGVKLQDLRRREAVSPRIRPQESIFGWDAKNGRSARNGMKATTDNEVPPKTPEEPGDAKSPEVKEEKLTDDLNGSENDGKVDSATNSPTTIELHEDNIDTNKKGKKEKREKKHKKAVPKDVRDTETIEETKHTRREKVGDREKNEKYKTEKDTKKDALIHVLDKEHSHKREQRAVSSETNNKNGEEEGEKQDPPWVRKGKNEPGVLRHVPLKERGDAKPSRKKSEAPWSKRKIKKKDGIHLQTLKDWREAINDPSCENIKVRRKDLPTDEMIATIESFAPDSPDGVRPIDHAQQSRTNSPVHPVPEAAPASMRVVKKSRQIEIDENGRPKSGLYDVNVTLSLGQEKKTSQPSPTTEDTNVGIGGKSEKLKKSQSTLDTKLSEQNDTQKSNEPITEATIFIERTQPEDKKETDETPRRGWRKNRGNAETKTKQHKQIFPADEGEVTPEGIVNKNNNDFGRDSPQGNKRELKLCEGVKTKKPDKRKDDSATISASTAHDTRPEEIARPKTEKERTQRHLIGGRTDENSKIAISKNEMVPKTKRLEKKDKDSPRAHAKLEKITNTKGLAGKMSPSKEENNLGLGLHQPWKKSNTNLGEGNGFGEAKIKAPSKLEPLLPWQNRRLRKYSLPPENDLRNEQRNYGNQTQEDRMSSANTLQNNQRGVGTGKQPGDGFQTLPRIMSKEQRKPKHDQPQSTEKNKEVMTQAHLSDSKKTTAGPTRAKPTNSDILNPPPVISYMNQQKERDIGIYATLPKRKTHRPKIVPKTLSYEGTGTIPECPISNSNGADTNKEEENSEETQPQIKIPSIRERIKRLTSINEACEKVPTPKVKFTYDPSSDLA